MDAIRDLSTKKPLLKCVPATLVAVRVALGPILLAFCAERANGLWIVSILATAMLSDVFDGVIARRLRIATTQLRIADSYADAWFFACVCAAACVAEWREVSRFSTPILLSLGLQLASYAYDFRRYGRPATFHAYSAKLWGLSLYVAAIALLAFHTGAFLWASFAVGLVSGLDALAIKLTLTDCRCDVHSYFHAKRLA
jgi:CDP-diacylglycerol--glycerol-3-phosphate 3-phosphatidyltransferase